MEFLSLVESAREMNSRGATRRVQGVNEKRPRAEFLPAPTKIHRFDRAQVRAALTASLFLCAARLNFITRAARSESAGPAFFNGACAVRNAFLYTENCDLSVAQTLFPYILPHSFVLMSQRYFSSLPGRTAVQSVHK
jgi:hypothetical protein